MSSTIKNAGYYTLGNIVKAITSFVLLPIFANVLGTEQYGVLNLLQTFSSILVVLMTFATERSLYRLYYDYHTDEEKKDFLSTVFWTINLTSVLIIVLTFIIGHSIVRYVGDVDVYRALMPTVIYTFLGALINYSQIIMQVEEKGGRFLFVSLLFLIVYNVISLFFLFFYSRSVEALIYGNLLANLFVMPFAYSSIRHNIKLTFHFDILKYTLRFSMPMFVAIVFAWVLHFTDRIFIANFASYSEAGVYSLASKFVQIAILMVGAIAQAYSPYFYRIANTYSLEDAKKHLKPVCNVYTGVICSLFIAVAFFSKPVLIILFNDSYSGALFFVYLLSVSGIFSQQSSMLNLMVYQNKKVVSLSAMGMVCGVISVILNVLFIPCFGAIAAGFSNLIVGFLIFILTHFLAKRNYYIPYGYGFMFYAVLIVVVSFFLDISGMGILIVLLCKMLCSVALLYLANITKIIDVNDYIFVYDKFVKPYIYKIFRN